MPKYLGIDFLSQVLRQKDQLLSRMLISCPGSVDPVLQNEHIQNEKCRVLLWDKALPEKFLHEKPICYYLKLVSPTFGNQRENFQVKQEIEFVPSSNPDSPAPSFLSESFSEFEDEIVQDVYNYLNRHDVNNTLLTLADSDNNWEQLEDNKELEEMCVMGCLEEFMKRVPHFQNLVTRLKPGRVTDPFLGEQGHLRSEKRTIGLHLCYDITLKESDTGMLWKEIHKKQSHSDKAETEPFYLSSPMIISSNTHHVEISNLKTFAGLIEEKEEIFQNDENYIHELQGSFKCEKLSKHRKYETISGEVMKVKTSSFIEMNHKGQKHDAVKPLPTLPLESPPPYSNPWYNTEYENRNANGMMQCADLKPFKIKTEKSSYICSPHSQSKIAKHIDVSSKLFDKMSSYILQVPDLQERQEDQLMMVPNIILSLVKEDFTGELELQLRWDPLPKSTTAGSVTNIQAIGYNGNMSDKMVKNLELSPSVCKLLWKDIYVTNSNVSTKCLDTIKEIKTNSPQVILAKKEKATSQPQSNETKKPMDVSCGKHLHVHSGIDDFVLLRTGVSSSTTLNYPPKAIVKAMNVQQINNNSNKIEVEDKDFGQIIEVSLSKEFQTALCKIEDFVRPILLELQETGYISSSYTTTNLSTDYTRFILKQEEKKKVDKLHNQESTKYRMLICLHTLITAAELLREVGLELAQDYIASIRVQHRKTLGNSLDHILDDLSVIQQRFNKTQLAHPKVVTTCEYIRARLPPSSILSLQDKTLVIVFRGIREVYSSLVIQLQQVKDLKLTILDGNSRSISVINNAHVIVTDIAYITENFPWSRFTSVLAYENKGEWLKKFLIEKADTINHFVCLKGVASSITQPLRDECKYKACFQEENLTREIYTLIGSSKVTRNIDLLRCMEQKFDIIIIEREYAKIVKGEQTTPSKLCLQPDLMLDHNTGVIIENIVNFTREEGYKNAVDLVLSTSFKCQMCSIILLCDTNANTAYPFAAQVQSHLAKFHGCLVSIQSSFPQFMLDVFYSYSVPQTASLIRRLCERTRDSSDVFSKHDWSKRDWLTGEISEHERFLLGFPSLNSFSAQLMLTVMPLNKLLSLPFVLLKKELPWISESILKDFKETADCGSIIQSKEDENYSYFDSTIQIPEYPQEAYCNYLDISSEKDAENTEAKWSLNETCQHPDSERTSYNFASMSPSSGIPSLNPGLPTSSSNDYYQLINDDFTPSMEVGMFCSSQANNGFLNYHKTDKDQFEGFNVKNSSYCIERNPQQRSLSPLHSSCEQLIEGTSNIFSTSRSKNKSKPISRFVNRSRGEHEIPDVIGVVQPKPRKIEKRKPKRAVSSESTYDNGQSHQSEMIENSRYFYKRDSYEKVQKKRKLTFEAVPGAKNGQTRLTFI